MVAIDLQQMPLISVCLRLAITRDDIKFDFIIDTPLVPGIFPSQEVRSRTIRTVTLVMQVTEEEYKCLDEVHNLSEQQLQSYDASKIVHVLQDIGPLSMARTELEHTDKMFQVLTSLLGEDYKVFSHQEMLGLRRPYCRHATSQPDLGFYKKLGFTFKHCVHGAVLLPAVIVMGEAGEDKKVGLAGEVYRPLWP